MTIRKIETPLFSNGAFDGLLDAARTVANRFDAQVDVCFIRPIAANAALYDAGFGFANPNLIEQIEEEEQAATDLAHKRFNAWTARHPLSPKVRWKVEDGSVGAVVAERGCLADLVLLQRPLDKGPSIDEAFEGAVFGAGRLAMVIDGELPDRYLDHVLIAWNHSTEAARAVALAMPFLQEAKQVSIFSIGEDGGPAADFEDLHDYLALHGVHAKRAAFAPNGSPVGEALLDTIEECKVTMVVMGAYTHGRVRQMLFGGITQRMLTKPGIPALMAH